MSFYPILLLNKKPLRELIKWLSTHVSTSMKAEIWEFAELHLGVFLNTIGSMTLNN